MKVKPLAAQELPVRKYGRFKVESEGGMFDIYEESVNGGFVVNHRDINVKCILVAWDISAEAAHEFPTLHEYVIPEEGMQPMLEAVI